MPVTLTIADVCLRILLTALASAALGFDRSVEGHPAGVKTMLVALAACLSMVQANWLINTVGKAPNSFVTLDLMRLPLGILTGVGAILKKGSDVIGLTTAATLWFVTVIGLCFGGGQIFLGVVGAAIGFAILRGLKRIEQRFRQKLPPSSPSSGGRTRSTCPPPWRRSASRSSSSRTSSSGGIRAKASRSSSAPYATIVFPATISCRLRLRVSRGIREFWSGNGRIDGGCPAPAGTRSRSSAFPLALREVESLSHGVRSKET